MSRRRLTMRIASQLRAMPAMQNGGMGAVVKDEQTHIRRSDSSQTVAMR